MLDEPLRQPAQCAAPSAKSLSCGAVITERIGDLAPTDRYDKGRTQLISCGCGTMIQDVTKPTQRFEAGTANSAMRFGLKSTVRFH